MDPGNTTHPQGTGRAAPRRLAIACAAIVVGAILAPAEARADAVDAQTRQTARKLGADGMALYDQGDYAAALAKFTLANKLVPAPTLALRAARCLVRLGRLVEASEKYLEITRTDLDPKALAVQRKALAEAVGEREKILPMIPSLVVAVQGPRGETLSVSVDGVSMPVALLGERRPVDPGTHRVEVQRGAEPPIARQVTVDVGDASRLDVALPPLPPPPRPPPPPDGEPVGKAIGRVGIAVAVAGAVVGVSHGLVALVQQSSLVERCGEARACPHDAAGAAGFYDVTRAATTIGFIAAGVGVALSIPYFLKPKAPADGGGSALRVTPWVGAGAGLRGEF